MIVHLFLSALITAFSSVHDFKMSVCEITYLEVQTAFEVKYYLFQDDLKEALYGDPLAPQLDAGTVSSYILEKTKLEVDGQPIALSFKEIKEREDQVLVAFYSEKIKCSAHPVFHIFNHIFLEKFRKQTNMVYLTMPGRSKITQIMNGGKTEVKIGL